LPQILHHHQLLSMFVLQFLQTNSIDLGIIEFVLSLLYFALSPDLVVFSKIVFGRDFVRVFLDLGSEILLEISWRVPAEIRP